MRLRIVGGAVVLLAGVGLAVGQQQASVPTLSTPSDVAAPAISKSSPDLNGGVSPRSPAKSDIQNLLAQVTEAATGKGELPTLVSYLAKADRDAIGDVRSRQWADLDGRADQFHKDWQATFGMSFRLSDKQSVIYGDESFPIRPGNEAKENASNGLGSGPGATGDNQLKGPTTQPAAGAMPASMPGMAGTEGMGGMGDTTQASAFPNVPPTGTQTMGENPSDNEATAVRTGTVELPATASQPPLVVHLLNEGTMVASWKIDLPTTINADRLHDSLLRHLTWLDEHRASWPTEMSEAYQAVSREMLAALIDAANPQSASDMPTSQPTQAMNTDGQRYRRE
jgi:hypothetical protein